MGNDGNIKGEILQEDTVELSQSERNIIEQVAVAVELATMIIEPIKGSDFDDIENQGY